MPIKNYGLTLIRDWLLKSFPKIVKNAEGEDEEVSISNLYRIRNRALLKELILYDGVMNVDRVMALSMLMIYREEKMILYQGDMGRASQRDNKDGLENDEYFSKNYDDRLGMME